MTERLHIISDSEEPSPENIDQARNQLADAQNEMITLQGEIARTIANLDQLKANRDAVLARLAILQSKVDEFNGSLT